jgi:hypothetical protein
MDDENKLGVAIELARQASRDKGFFWFIDHVFRYCFEPKEKFVTGDFIKGVAERFEKYSMTIDVSGRDHFKSTRLHADILYSMFIDKSRGFEAQYFSYSEAMAGYQLKKLKQEISYNPFFTTLVDRKPQAESVLSYSWGEDAPLMTINPKGLLGNNRGIHADRIYVDDPLKTETDGAAPDPIAIKKINNAIRGDILPMIKKPNGICRIVGCVAPDTLVMTREGLVEIGSLFPKGTDFTKKQLIPYRQEVFGKDGWDETSNLFVNGMTDTNIITLGGGYSLECSQIHPLWSSPASTEIHTKQIAWRKSSELKVGDWVALSIGANIFSEREDITLDQAYMFGLYVAEGSAEYAQGTKRLTITNTDPYVIRFLKEKFNFNNTDGLHNRKTNKDLFKTFEDFGMPLKVRASKKFIPPKILLQSERIQVAFLQGLYDGDGHSTYIKAGQTAKPSLAVVLTSSSPKELKTVQIMLANFGIITHLNQGYHKGHHKSDGTWIRDSVSWTLKTGGHSSASYLARVGFRIERKQKEFIYTGNVPERFKGFIWKRIKKIEKSQSPTVDFTIPKTQSFVTNCCVSHNTPQTSQDFFYDKKGIGSLFNIIITPAIIDEPNKIALWPERYTYKQLNAIRISMDSDKFEREYMAMPVSLSRSYINRSKLVALSTEMPLDFAPQPELEEKIVVAGFDIGKKVHPSHLAVFIKEFVREDEDGHDIFSYKQIYSKWLDKVDYKDQVDLLNRACEYFNISRLIYDDTRGELTSYAEKNVLDGCMVPMVMSSRRLGAMAANFGGLVNQDLINFINERRQITQILMVDNDLRAQENSQGHSDSFYSCAMAVWEAKTKVPKIWSLYGDDDKDASDSEASEEISEEREKTWANTTPDTRNIWV